MFEVSRERSRSGREIRRVGSPPRVSGRIGVASANREPSPGRFPRVMFRSQPHRRPGGSSWSSGSTARGQILPAQRGSAAPCRACGPCAFGQRPARPPANCGEDTEAPGCPRCPGRPARALRGGAAPGCQSPDSAVLDRRCKHIVPHRAPTPHAGSQRSRAAAPARQALSRSPSPAPARRVVARSRSSGPARRALARSPLPAPARQALSRSRSPAGARRAVSRSQVPAPARAVDRDVGGSASVAVSAPLASVGYVAGSNLASPPASSDPSRAARLGGALPRLRSMWLRPKSCSAASKLWGGHRSSRLSTVSGPPLACASRWCSSKLPVSGQRRPRWSV